MIDDSFTKCLKFFFLVNIRWRRISGERPEENASKSKEKEKSWNRWWSKWSFSFSCHQVHSPLCHSLCVLICLSKVQILPQLLLQIDSCYFSSLMLAGKNTMTTYFPMMRTTFLTLNFYKWLGCGNKTKLNSNEDIYFLVVGFFIVAG